MRVLLPALVLVLGVPGTTAAMPVPDSPLVPDVHVPLLHCGYVEERAVRWSPQEPDPREPPGPPKPPPNQTRWRNVTVHVDPDACAAPAAELCSQVHAPCCQVVPGAEPCRPSTLMPGAGGDLRKGQRGVTLPMGGGACLTYELPWNATAETHECWAAPTQGGK